MNKIPRDILIVYEQIVTVIPETEYELINELENFVKSLCNIAPEIRYTREVYIPFCNILQKHIPMIVNLNNNDEKWKFEVRDIFSNKKNL